MNRKILTTVAVVTIAAGLSACGGQSEAEQQAETIAVECFNRVQPQDFPRISTSEERRIRSCAYATADTLPEPLAAQVTRALDSSDLISDGM